MNEFRKRNRRELPFTLILVDGQLGICWYDEDREDAETRVRERKGLNSSSDIHD